MGGSQSWLSCDATYPQPDGTPYSGELESGDPIIAVFMFLGTLVGLLLLTFVVHCGIVACRACRSRRRKRRHGRKQQQPIGADGPAATLGAIGGSQSSLPSVLVAVQHRSSGDASLVDGQSPGIDKSNVIGGEGDNDNEGDSLSSDSSSSSLATSSDTSIDSTTARIAAQIAHRRRSRFLDLRGGVGLPGASPIPSLSASPAAARVGFDNPAFINDRLRGSFRAEDAV